MKRVSVRKSLSSTLEFRFTQFLIRAARKPKGAVTLGKKFSTRHAVLADKNAKGPPRKKAKLDIDETQENASDSGITLVEKEKVTEAILSKFGVRMPDDFYQFWEFCSELDEKKPADAISSIGLTLVGPYDVQSGLFDVEKIDRESCLTHWRYYYDPPEFQTILKGDDTSGFHIGYFRDEPDALPVFAASNNAVHGCKISPEGENLFSAVKLYIGREKKTTKDKTHRANLERVEKALLDCASKHGIPLEANTKTMKSRSKRVVCKLFHCCGLVVPVDDNEVGYREVPETPGALKKMFARIEAAETDEERMTAFDPIQELMTLVQFANDECDYGMGIELGLHMFSCGSLYLHKTILKLLPMGYQFIGRELFGEIITAHLKNRRSGSELSAI
ncbi:PREDICTED: UPF0609 protein C4orf27 homolog [Priapulus caudatus]|uniref:UPF0609 protein C4orf27 homolog n=1 Tax=Priapulus caudatus TaxID=37621 RepID=A0ABM1DQB6_PRICU|nr:PREDICTED: UPF0609 protein C4orf27 homolog [Priapulus caudatus]